MEWDFQGQCREWESKSRTKIKKVGMKVWVVEEKVEELWKSGQRKEQTEKGNGIHLV